MYFNLLGINESYKLNTDLYIAREYFNFSLKDVIKTLNFSDVRLVKVNGPLWSLIYEWWLYFFGLFFVSIFFAKSKISQIISLILLIVVYYKIEQLQGLVYIVIWMMGFIFFIIGKTRSKWNNLLVFIAVVGLIACNYFLNFFQNKINIATLPIVQILFSILFLGIIFIFPKSSLFNKVSKFSYTLYIIHFPIFLFFLSLFHKSTYNSIFLSIILSFFSIAIVLFLSYKVHIYIENKKYFTGLINNLLLRVSSLFSSLSKNIK
jgi:peptidoglycan/LPS O-acetylase OafA/YrhL